MASTIKIKRSTGSEAPGSLAFGELAYSSGSGKFYFGSSTDGNTVTVTEVGGAHYTNLLSATAGTASASKAVILDGSSGISGLGTVTATSFVGALTGNASTATTLQTARTINGVSFDGSANISFGTDAVTEGSTNLYYTDERVDDRVADLIVAGTNITKTYNDETGTLTIAAATDTSAVRGLFSAVDAGGDGSFSYNSATGEFTYTGPSASEVRAHFSAANSGTGYGSLAYADGVFTFTKVTDADIRSAISAGTGISITDGVIANTGVTSAVAGTGVSVSGATGAVTFSIGQAVGTTDNVTFNNVTVSGSLNSDDITAASISIDGAATVTGALTVTGNLTVSGTTTTVNSTTLDVADKNITVAKGAVDAAAANGAGLTVEGPATAATLTYASADDTWNFNKQVKANVTGNLTGNADTATKWATARDLSLTGDATATLSAVDGSAAVSAALTLATVNSNVGEYGDSVTVPTFTVNAKGLITAASETAIPTATTSVKGLASFNSTEFTVTDGAVSVAALDGGTY